MEPEQENQRVVDTALEVAAKGDLVMRKAHQYKMKDKLSPKWTGPFRVTEALGNGAYRLETLEGGAIPRTWNATHLKFNYS